MKARLIIFPIRGRNWCFSRSIDHSTLELLSALTPSTFKELWKKISTSNGKPTDSKAELLIDFVSKKMNRAWTGLEKAPPGSFKNKLYGLGLLLLARVKPSEIFLKSTSKEVTKVEVAYPSSLSARHVRRKLRHIALRGTIIHKRYFYGSVSLLPPTTAFAGSERLLQLVSDSSEKLNSSVATVNSKKMHMMVLKMESTTKLVFHGCCSHQRNLSNSSNMEMFMVASASVLYQTSARPLI